jgi:hypothetical protein
MIKKIILKETGKRNFILSVVGTLVGFILLLGSLQLYIDIKAILSNDEEILSPDYIIINKKLSLFNSLKSDLSTFSDEEIHEISNKKFIDDIVPFTKNQFTAGVFTPENHMIPGVYTDIFFEAVPNKYIDIKKQGWQWENVNDKVPVIVPKDYLNLYNFGYSISQGLPQVPANMVSKIDFYLRIKGNGTSITLKAYIIGFSDRINSVLVPKSFLDWANENYGDQSISKPSRLMLVSKEPSNPELHQFIKSKHYETNEEKLKSSKINTLLRYLMYILSFISAIIIVLSFYTFVLSFQLIIYRSREKIETLLLLGYAYKQISRKYNELFIYITSAVFLISILITWALNKFYIKYAGYKGFEIEQGIEKVFLVSLLLSALIFILNAIFISKQVKRIT